MAVTKSREIRETRGKLIADAQALIPSEGGAWTPEIREKFDKMMADADVMLKDAERIELADATVEGLRTTNPPNARPENMEVRERVIPEYRRALKRHGAKALEHVSAEARSVIEGLNTEYFDALKEYLCRGGDGIKPESRAILNGERKEFRDMGVATGGAGGFFVPQGFVYDIEDALKFYGSMLQSSEMMPTATGQPLPYPTDNDTTVAGELVGEGQQVTTADIALGSITFGAFKFSTKMIKISIELLQDSAFDLEAFTKKKFAQRLGRILNTYFTTGTGTAQPKGIITGATIGVGTGSGINTIGDDNQTTPDPTTQVGYIDLTNLEHSVDPLYRPGAAFMFNDNVLRFVKTLKDKFGRPLWVPGLTSHAPDSLLGYPYWINNDMDVLATGKKTVLFGQVSKYLIRQVRELGILRLSERFADYGQVAFIGFARYDGNLLDAGTHPVKYLQQN
jgi:HK97 family phage major capsid protein